MAGLEGLLEGHARQNASYALQKLSFLDRYLPVAFEAASKKLHRVYIDLFAGPGVWQDRTGRRHLGSPIKSLLVSGEHRGGFTRAFLVNRDADDHQALKARVDEMVELGLTNLPRKSIDVILADANEEVGRILTRINPRAWVFVFADPENPSQWPWSSVEALRAQGHTSIELYALLPVQMALARMASYRPEHHTEEALTRFFCSKEAWQMAVQLDRTSAQYRQFHRRLEKVYAECLRRVGWQFVDTRQRIVGSRNQPRYHMVFATDHPAAFRIAGWEARGEQMDLGL